MTRLDPPAPLRFGKLDESGRLKNDSAAIRASDDFVANIWLAGERIDQATTGALHIVAVKEVARSGRGSRRARVTLETLDDALRPSTQLVEIGSIRELTGMLRDLARTSRKRAKVHRRVSASGGVALVDELVGAAIQYAGSTVGSVVATLRSGQETVVTMTPADAPPIKAWLEDGRLLCSFEVNPMLRWSSARLVVRQQFFATLASVIVGQSVSRIADHPMLPAHIRVGSYRPVGNETELNLTTETRVITKFETGD